MFCWIWAILKYTSVLWMWSLLPVYFWTHFDFQSLQLNENNWKIIQKMICIFHLNFESINNLVMKYTGPIVESRGLHAIFQKRAKYLKIWAKMYKIWKYFENRQSHVCNYHMHETAGISWICFWNALVFFSDSEVYLK